MAAPPNTTPATATAIDALPYSLTLDVQDAPNQTGYYGGRHVVWFTYTAGVGDVAIAVMAQPSAEANYTPTLSVWTGEPDDLSSYQMLGGTVVPVLVPVVSGTTYTIKVVDGSVDEPLGASLVLTAIAAPKVTASAGSLLVSDDTVGLPTMILSATDGLVLRVVNDPPAHEIGDILASGVIGCGPLAAGDEFRIYGADLTLLYTVSGVFSADGFEPQIRSNGVDTFYTAQNNPVSAPAVVKTVSAIGVVGLQTWTLPINSAGIRSMAPSRDGTILYYGQGQYGSAIHRYDLVAGAALADLVAGIGYRQLAKDLLVLPDDTVLAAYRKQNEPYDDSVIHYSAAGAVIRTYTFDAHRVNRLAMSADAPDSFWAWLFLAGTDQGTSRFQQIETATGTVLVTFDVVTFEGGVGPSAIYAPPLQYAMGATFGISVSCPFYELRQTILVGDSGADVAAALAFSMPMITLGASVSNKWGASIPQGSGQVSRRLIRRLRQTPHLSAEEVTLFFSKFQLDMETGVGLTTGQGITPQVMLQWSTDHGHTWSNEHWIESGPIGAYRWRAIWRRLGRARDMVFRVVISDPVKIALIDAYVDVAQGQH
jgi:hypothetical protein